MVSVPSTRELGDIQSVVFSWESNVSILSPLAWLRKKYLYIEGNFQVTSDSNVHNVFQPSREKIEDEKDLLASIVQA
jgi:hypothetical protein